MPLVRNTPTIWLLAALVLFSGMPGASEVFCVSFSGHRAVEAASCCWIRGEAPGGPSTVAAVAPAEECNGCTDLSLVPAFERNGLRQGSHAFDAGHVAVLPRVLTAGPSPVSPREPNEPAASYGLLAGNSLRC